MISAVVPNTMKDNTDSLIQILSVYHWTMEHHGGTLPNRAWDFQTCFNYLNILGDYLHYWCHARSLVSDFGGISELSDPQFHSLLH